jgi:hypothetical protein
MESEPGRAASVPILSVDGLMEELRLPRVDVLHMDTQGAELDALAGASAVIAAGRLRFVLISTHHYSICGDPDIHGKCLRFLAEHGAHVIASHTVLESFSGDGLIAASFDPRDRDFGVPITLNHTDRSLFRPHEEDLAILMEAAAARRQ